MKLNIEKQLVKMIQSLERETKQSNTDKTSQTVKPSVK